MKLYQNYLIYSAVVIIFGLQSCSNMDNSAKANGESVENDTTVVKVEKELRSSFEKDFYSQVCLYYLVSGQDTLDLIVSVSDIRADSSLTVSTRTIEGEPTYLEFELNSLQGCFSVIKEDFDLSRLRRIYLQSPLRYVDLARELSEQYESQFGRNRIDYDQLDTFLLNSTLDKDLNKLLNPINKKTQRYSIEKFHLIDKEHYPRHIVESDSFDYPEFSIHGTGIGVMLEDV